MNCSGERRGEGIRRRKKADITSYPKKERKEGRPPIEVAIEARQGDTSEAPPAPVSGRRTIQSSRMYKKNG